MEANQEKLKQPPNPRPSANFLSIMFYWWVNQFMALGASKDLEVQDLFATTEEDNSEQLGLILKKEWDKELEKCAAGESKAKPSLTKALYRAFGLKFILVGLLALLEECGFRIVQPLCLGQLVRYFEKGDDLPTSYAYMYATGLVLSSALYTFTHHPYFFECQHTGMKLRVSACSLLYQKSLRLSQKALGQTTIGQMVNLMSNDVNRFDFSVIFLHYLWIGPIQTLITAVILYNVIGPSCLAGLAILILFVPLQSWMGRVFSRLRMKTAKRTDERIRTMNEIISGMRVIKMYTWEKPFGKLIELCRRKEVDVIRQTAYFRALNMSLFLTSSKLIIFLTILVFVLSGNSLTAEQVFLTVALFNNVRLIMTLFFPGAITMAAEARVSVKRIEKFLLLDETSKKEGLEVRPPLAECLIDLKQVTVKWPAAAETEDNTLTDVSFRVKPGKVLAVVGQVGSGKSSLLNVILGELAPSSGSCDVKGKMAFASQEPWIFSGTIRQNILCGTDYDIKRYKKVVKAAALERDFHLFPQGDQTAVGEKGVSLSGGQKARVNLARCLYVDADIYLMDDPLSAVDTHVGRHLFDKAVKGFLRDKIRVLVTHQLQYLKEVDTILVLKGGRVEAIGTYEELNKIGVDLAKTIVDEEEELEGPSRTLSECEVEGSFPIRSASISSSGRHGSFSKSSMKSITSNKENEDKPAFAEESRQTGSVGFAVYLQYFKAGGGCFSSFILVINFIITQILFNGSEYWLSLWTNAEEVRGRMNFTVESNITNITEEQEHLWRFLEDIDTYTGMYVFTGMVFGVFLFSLIRTIHFFVMCMSSSVTLHNKMFHAVIRAQLHFFDHNPVGRILNRFSKDIGCMDEMLPATFFDVITIFLTAIGILMLVGAVNLWLLLPIFFLGIIFFKFRQFYLVTARSVKRLESTTRSPVFTHLSTSLVGLTTVRAHKSEVVFQRVFDDYQDIHSSAWYMFLATSRWFGVWLDWMCVFYIGCVTYACVSLRETLTGSEAGLAISSAMALTGMFQWGVRQSAEVENQMTSVERVMEYSKLPSEAALESTNDKKPPKSWPSEGNIQFNRMSLCYKESDPPVLKSISCTINAKEKIGIVGRTGAGKSSLITALFRLTEPEGKILIDGIDTKSIGLHDLRSKISIIPQDPVLFSGPLRKNLDPFGEYDDSILWSALEDVKLKESTMDLESGLDSIMTEGGSNLSVGQRQLVCLARAILRKNRILVLDEATANVDQKTDSLIQLTIRDKFKDCTVLTIAHRLNTIMDSDRVAVMDAGYLKEFDEPAVLLENPKTIFYGLVEQTGVEGAAELTDLAKQAAEERRMKDPNSSVVIPNGNGNAFHHPTCPLASEEDGLDENSSLLQEVVQT